MDKISRKQQQIVKAKIKGHKNKDIGAVQYPNAKPESQAVLVSRELKKTHVAKYYEQSKLQALKEHNITWSRIIKPVSEALEAIKPNGDIDHNTRLSASKQATSLLELKHIDEEAKEQLKNLPEDINELEIQRLLFKRTN